MLSLRRRPFTAAAVAALVFFALVGSALALSKHGSAQTATKPVYQKRCATGAVKAIALVVADQNRGFQTSYVSDPSFFKARWSCKAKTVFQARRVDRGVYDVRLLGNTGLTPLVTPIGDPVKVGTTSLPDGGVEVKLVGVSSSGQQDYAVDESFVIVFV